MVLKQWKVKEIYDSQSSFACSELILFSYRGHLSQVQTILSQGNSFDLLPINISF